jgi:ribonuclease BN (tRNA processing enzyme)
LAYITDTTADLQQAYVHTIRDVDLLLHECNFADKHAKFAIDTGHSNTTPVLEVFRASRARKLLISHLSPYSDDPDSIDLANAILSFPDIPQETVTIAEDRMQIEFGT